MIIKKIEVFFKGISPFGMFNGDSRFMSSAQVSVSIIIFTFSLVLVLILIALFFFYIRKGINILCGEASQSNYSKFNGAFIKEFGNPNHGIGKRQKYTTFGDRLRKKTKLIYRSVFWIIVFIAACIAGTYIWTS